MIVVLMGYMASGKSAVGKQLADVLSYNFMDLDDYIEQQEQMTIPEMFDQKKAIYFRKKETQYLSEVLETYDDIVLALGGGTPCYGNNIEAIQNNDKVVSVYLMASVTTLVDRLESEMRQRPLLNDINSKDELAEFVAKHMFERNAFYARADKTVLTDNKTIKAITEEIVLQLF